MLMFRKSPFQNEKRTPIANSPTAAQRYFLLIDPRIKCGAGSESNQRKIAG